MHYFRIIALLLIPCTALGYDNIADYEATAKKLYAKFSACSGEFWDKQFAIETERCVTANPNMSRFDCEMEADARVNDIPFERSAEACGELRPTTYLDPSDPYRMEMVSSVGAMSAMVDGHVAKGVKMFQECVAVGDVDCHYRLGVLMYKGEAVKQDKTEAIKLLKFAADNGHDEAQDVLNDIQQK